MTAGVIKRVSDIAAWNMRTLSNVNDQWHHFEQFKSLGDLRCFVTARDDHIPDSFRVNGIRSACWKAFLVTNNLDLSTWPARLAEERTQYDTYRKRYLQSPREDELDSFSDPLSQASNSPLTDFQRDANLKEEIFQDVERCMPDNLYFRQPSTRRMLLDILFVWSKLNPDISYRQGMHEVLAPLVWAVERDAIDVSDADSPSKTQHDEQILTIFDAAHVEHDSFALFTTVMDSLKTAYAARSSKGKGHEYSNSVGSVPEIVARSHKILHEQLMAADPQLAFHLIGLDIPPQLFLIRWIRLLFGREFPFDDCMELWDCVFSEGASSACVDFICVSMMLRIRWRLISADHNTALGILLHYPPLRSNQYPATLVDDARLLQQNLSAETGRGLVRKYTGKTPILQTPAPALQSASLDSSAIDSPQSRNRSPHLLPPPRPIHNPSNSFEIVMQNAARSVYSSGERLGVNKAVREAVGDVRKNVLSIRTDLRNRTHSRNTSTTSSYVESDTPASMQKRLDDLLTRNKSLAEMLEGAVHELWKQHKDLATAESNSLSGHGDRRVESFTMAIAKVQLAQVYLEDPELPLPEEEETIAQKPEHSGRLEVPFANPPYVHPVSFHESRFIPENLARSPPQASPGAEVDSSYFALTANPPQQQPIINETQLEDTTQQTHHDNGQSTIPGKIEKKTAHDAGSESKSRPSLEHSSFSWMLDQDSGGAKPRSSLDSGSFKNSHRTATTLRRNRNDPKTGFLFGD